MSWRSSTARPRSANRSSAPTLPASEANPTLDGHAMLTRCKVAGVLAIMHGRSVVSALDWELSGVVMDESDRVREWLLTEARRAAKKKVRDRAISRAMGEEIIAERRLERAKAAVLRWLERDGELASRDLRPKLKADIRDQFTAALAELEAVGDIVTVEVANGKRYRLSQVHAVPEVQPQNQVRHAVPEVQRVPKKGQYQPHSVRSLTRNRSVRPPSKPP